MCTVELITTMNWMQLKNDVITTARESHVTYHTYDKNHPVSVNEEKKRSCFQQMCCMLTTQNTALEGTYTTEKKKPKTETQQVLAALRLTISRIMMTP